jgi:transcriptional regulator with XRE-family HTH domain
MEQLKRLREARGLSQVKLAARADVNPATVNQIEGGKRSASPATLRKLADALDVSLYELIEGEPRPLVQPRLPDAGDERRTPSLRSWIDFAGRTADRWEAEFEEREAEWQAAEAHIRKNVKWLPNLSWAAEIFRTYANILEAANAELNYGLDVYETAEVQDLFKNTQRLEEIVERTKPWYQGEEAPRMAEVIDLQQAMAARVETITARSSQSA